MQKFFFQPVRSKLFAMALVLLVIAFNYSSGPQLGGWLTSAQGGLDPRCSNRSAKGQITCVIDKPVVSRHETIYSNILFAPGDLVEVTADGCVQTGGLGRTWKRYVNPVADSDLYHGLIRIPTGTRTNGLVRIKDVMGKRINVTGAGIPESALVLHLGYEDDDYSDNGYNDHDDGTDDQCKGSHGGPARIVITISRGVSSQPVESRFDFDVLSNSVDPNQLPYNPFWSWQLKNRGQIPSTSICHDFSKVDTIAGIPKPALAPSFADCTDQADLTSVDLPDGINQRICSAGSAYGLASGSFVGHVNWFPITVEGHGGWGSDGVDNDYTFSFYNQESGYPLSVNGRQDLHVEFDSDETTAYFKSPEWVAFENSVHDKNEGAAKRLFTGHMILTGLFGLDGEHGLKAELHPLYALAVKRDDYENDPSDEAWLMFVRNRGDEGFCSSQSWDAGFEDYTVRLPWHTGMTDVDVNWNKTDFDGTEGTSGPVVSKIPGRLPGAGVYVTFHLGPSSSNPHVDGTLHLVWKRDRVISSRSVPESGDEASRVPQRIGRFNPEQEKEGDAEERIREAIKQLTVSQRLQIEGVRNLSAARPVTHQLAAGGPVRQIESPPVRTRRFRLRAINAGPAIQKLQRDAAQIRALCAATRNSPPGLPSNICATSVRDH